MENSKVPSMTEGRTDSETEAPADIEPTMMAHIAI
jgi:hypothetical protein